MQVLRNIFCCVKTCPSLGVCFVQFVGNGSRTGELEAFLVEICFESSLPSLRIELVAVFNLPVSISLTRKITCISWRILSFAKDSGTGELESDRHCNRGDQKVGCPVRYWINHRLKPESDTDSTWLADRCTIETNGEVIHF